MSDKTIGERHALLVAEQPLPLQVTVSYRVKVKFDLEDLLIT